MGAIFGLPNSKKMGVLEIPDFSLFFFLFFCLKFLIFLFFWEGGVKCR